MNSSRPRLFLATVCLFLITCPHLACSQSQSDSSKKKALEENKKDTAIPPEEISVSSDAEKAEVIESVNEASSAELVRLSWEASHQNNEDRLNQLVNRCVELYEAEARLLQSQLTDFPVRGTEDEYQSLNDVATCLFIKAENLMNTGRTDEASALFQKIINEYGWAQSWDPRGWYWSVAEKSQASIDVLTGKIVEETELEIEKQIRTKPILHTAGTEKIVDYTKYGTFLNVGTPDYKYAITDIEGLAAAVGEGIYPNTSSVYNNPDFQKLRQEGRLKGSHWDFVNTEDLEAAYFKWVSASEPWGTRLFYLGVIFEKAQMYVEALRAYHALVVHFPKTIAWTYWQTPWYPGQAAIAKIRHIIRLHPELGVEEKWMRIEIENGFDNDTDNDVIRTYPGKILAKDEKIEGDAQGLRIEEKVELGNVVKKIGEGVVRLVQYENGHWQLLVNDHPFVIRGMTYAPTKVGQSPDKGTLQNWMESDEDQNGRIDGPYDSWVDSNRNNEQDADEPVVGDFALMKKMGVNTLRIYQHPQEVNKGLLRAMFQEYGIRVAMGNFLGKYAIGSGATWAEGTDYENLEHRANMFESVKKMVMEHKDEPYLLLWIMGNENNYGVACNADQKPEAYFKFVDEVAQWIKLADPNHPVAVNNGDILFLDVFAKNASHVDIFTANVYRGDYGFGSFWEQVRDAAGKPAFITEYGAPAYAPHLTLDEADQAQADYHLGNWLDIEENLAGNPRGAGNALGGIVFEWLDEWWKNYEPFRQDRKSDAVGPFPGGYYFEEWFGIVGQGNGQHSPFLRQPRKSYEVYQSLWNPKIVEENQVGD